jgi:hypothetical protein
LESLPTTLRPNNIIGLDLRVGTLSKRFYADLSAFRFVTPRCSIK